MLAHAPVPAVVIVIAVTHVIVHQPFLETSLHQFG
jgi:hypothetical protein